MTSCHDLQYVTPPWVKKVQAGNNLLFYLSSEEIDLHAKSIFGKLFSFAFLPPDALDAVRLDRYKKNVLCNNILHYASKQCRTFQEINRLPLHLKVKVNICKQVYNRINGQSPLYMNELLARNSDINDWNSRYGFINLACPRFIRGRAVISRESCKTGTPFPTF